MEATDSLILIFVIYVVQAEATCSPLIFPLSQKKRFYRVSLLIYSNVSNSWDSIYSVLFMEKSVEIILREMMLTP